MRDVIATVTPAAWARAVEVAWVRWRASVESIAAIARASAVEDAAIWLAEAAAARSDWLAAAAAAARWDSIAICILAVCVAIAACTKPSR